MVSPGDLGEGEAPQKMPFSGHSGDPMDIEGDKKQSSAQEGEQVRGCWVNLRPQTISNKERNLSKLLQQESWEQKKKNQLKMEISA